MAWSSAQIAWRHAYPDRAFAHYTGQSLPSSIRAVQYADRIDDNFFHVGHYWVLHGSPEAIERFAFAHGFVESTDDARWITPNSEALLGTDIGTSNLLVGYEREQSRNDWIWVYRGGLAIYNER
jgi:hypothetical protein